jgi:hypothetical protein
MLLIFEFFFVGNVDDKTMKHSIKYIASLPANDKKRKNS